MLKVTVLATLLAGIAMGTNIAANANPAKIEKRDSEIIVEVDRSNETLTEQGVKNTQDIVMNNIRKYATGNFRLLSSYTSVANAFAISVPSSYIEQIKNVPGVKSVTVNQVRIEVESLASSRGDPEPDDEYGGSENISAETMHKGKDTNDGEGTVIAILDNEFYFRGETKDENGKTVAAWKHETFTEFSSDEDVNVRFDGHPANWEKTFAYKQTLKRSELLPEEADLGKEGSLYFNNKVPFYYDYGGESIHYGSNNIQDDLDVSSEITYHGSHVASIAAGHAPKTSKSVGYYGIAPKAQLVCMKVFTNYKAVGVDKELGFSTSSGAYDIPIMNALEDCMKLGVDGINMSLGSNLNDFDKDTITVKTLKKLADSGILTSISAGNSGKESYKSTGAYSNWTSQMVETGILSGYANVPSATTVASGQPTKVFYENAFQMSNGDVVAYDDQIVNREYYDTEYDEEYRMSDLVEKYGSNLNWVYVPGFGTSTDYANVEVKGKIAVVNRGSTSFADKYAVAKSKGAVALVVINNDPTSNDFNFRMSFGDGFRPSMPCALVLYKDKEYFSKPKAGSMEIISKLLSDNPNYGRLSTFSSDGATYDLDLKPEITAPGDLIKGAVPPQKNEDRTEDRKYKVYEFLSGTSMSAPNYAGAQSVVLSRRASEYYSKENPTAAEKSAFAKYKASVDMRLASTANPMTDKRQVEGEDDEFFYTVTSPRRQGAGMVNLGAAYATDVYLEGYDYLTGKTNGKTKINLRNTEDINNGKVSLKFVIHNDGDTAQTYSASYSVMRPDIVRNNEFVTKDYNYVGEVDDKTGVPGLTYYVENVEPGKTPYERHTDVETNYGDVFYISRDIEYYASAEDCLAGIKSTIKSNRYVNTSHASEVNFFDDFEILPSLEYQSVYDKEIAIVNCDPITVGAGESKVVELRAYNLTEAQKNEILEFYEYGTYLEGYVTLTNNTDSSKPQLSIPYLGFFGGANSNFEKTPVFEPFNFEKDKSTVYPSDLVNDIAKTLIGKDKADVGSMWVAGYVKEGAGLNIDAILQNNDNFANLAGFHLLGTENGGNYYEDAKNNLYVGSSYYTNTMIIQQYILRSCYDNYFTITNNETGKVVYRSALQDMLFGDGDWGQNNLYKSHIDDNYLAAGYVNHRAYGVIPLYDEHGQPYPSGEYTVRFNYLLSGTGTWVNYDYTLHIDSDAPIVTSIEEKGDNIRINIEERNLTSVAVGRYTQDMKDVVIDKKNGKAYIEVSKQFVEDTLFGYIDEQGVYQQEGYNSYQGSGRLYIKLTDAAFGQMGCIVRFDYDDDMNVLYKKYVMVENHSLLFGNDFEDDGKNITLVTFDSTSSSETPVEVEGPVIVSRGAYQGAGSQSVSFGCFGNIESTSIVLATISFIGIVGVALSLVRRKKLGGND